MADTPRTQSELLTLYANNTSRQISAQSGRDFIVSTYQPQMWLPGGRLTLTSGVPVTATDVIGASTIYYTPYLHNGIGLYDGTSWKLYSFTERSIALSGLTSGLNYDVFLYDNTGTLTLELTAWTNDTTRATALTMQDGVYVKSGATTRRYLGTIRTTGTTTTEDSGGGTTTQVGGKRLVWNAYNQVPRPLAVIDTTNTWSYTTDTWRVSDGATGPANCVECVVGLATAVSAEAKSSLALVSNSARAAKCGIGVDSTSSPSGLRTAAYNSSASASYQSPTARYSGTLAAGYHYLSWLEKGPDGTATWIGDDGGSGPQTGLFAEVMG